MPDFLPDVAEAGTLNVPGIAGVSAGIHYISQEGVEGIFQRERREACRCARELEKLGFTPLFGEDQGGTLSFTSKFDCEEIADFLGKQGICVRAGLHCAPLAHESAGTLESGTVRVSFGHEASDMQTQKLLKAAAHL
jgi:selenocysteine lyase/cysteine desulfurase